MLSATSKVIFFLVIYAALMTLTCGKAPMRTVMQNPGVRTDGVYLVISSLDEGLNVLLLNSVNPSTKICVEPADPARGEECTTVEALRKELLK